MKTIYLSLTAMLLVCLYGNSQELQQQDIDHLLDTQGELTFTFRVDNEKELGFFTKLMTIVAFNGDTQTIKAWANREQFQNFLGLNIPYKVYKDDNDINERLMSDDISEYSKAPKLGYTLEFPLTAYPTYADYAAQMQNFETAHSDIVDFFSIGPTGQGDKELLFVKISDNVLTDEAEPKLLYTATMHGDELTGFPIMMNLVDYLITAYRDENHPDHARITDLINGAEIWINPNANPDGTYHLSADNTSVAHARRGNANNVDLNRNYPDNLEGAHPDGEVYQTETLTFMELAENNHFVVAANFHSGIELVNYPWDNTYDRHPDDSWFVLTAGEYRDNAQNNSPSGYMDDENNGITNGADWYLVNGSRQDYMNHDHRCKEMTIELSTIKKPYSSQLKTLWNYNKDALIDYLIQGTYGFRGFIKDVNTEQPIEGATIMVAGHDKLGSWTTSDSHGSYYRPIFAGTYDLVVEAPNYEPMVLTAMRIENYQTKQLGTIRLAPIVPTDAESSIVGSPDASVTSKPLTNSYEIPSGPSFSNVLIDTFKSRIEEK
ncbi:M14 family zinc carboxypeptidase [Winogradskyella sp.]|uniref:M14 family zinc carboxypeptidase n=1 Tax=Winogradskyella sp. TaxID=1883156 RepID=UPI003BAA3156